MTPEDFVLTAIPMSPELEAKVLASGEAELRTARAPRLRSADLGLALFCAAHLVWCARIVFLSL
jgi:hypothetical protein